MGRRMKYTGFSIDLAAVGFLERVREERGSGAMQHLQGMLEDEHEGSVAEHLVDVNRSAETAAARRAAIRCNRAKSGLLGQDCIRSSVPTIGLQCTTLIHQIISYQDAPSVLWSGNIPDTAWESCDCFSHD